MNQETVLVLTVLAVLQVKHCFFDFVVQTPYQFLNKGTYGHPGGFLHAGLHVVGTLPALLIMSPPFWAIAVILVGEFVVHYHVDWSKAQIEKRLQLSPSGLGHYIALGVDQLMHQLTYLAIVAVPASVHTGTV